MDETGLLSTLRSVGTAVHEVLSQLSDWGLAGTRPGQYRSDLAADKVAVELLLAAGLGVLSEESGLHEADRELLAVIDPVDGSTNAARRLPWYATSICVLDSNGPLVSLVVNQATGTRYEAVRGKGATRDGEAILRGTPRALKDAVIAVSGYPPAYLGWRQFRALGAVALDLCAVADGSLDGYLDCNRGAHGAWDYLGGLLVCREAGAAISDTTGEDLVIRAPELRRSPVAASSPALLEELVAALQAARAPR